MEQAGWRVQGTDGYSTWLEGVDAPWARAAVMHDRHMVIYRHLYRTQPDDPYVMWEVRRTTAEPVISPEGVGI